MIPVIAAGAALFAGGVAVGKALGGSDDKDKKDEPEASMRYVPEEYVKKQLEKGKMEK